MRPPVEATPISARAVSKGAAELQASADSGTEQTSSRSTPSARPSGRRSVRRSRPSLGSWPVGEGESGDEPKQGARRSTWPPTERVCLGGGTWPCRVGLRRAALENLPEGARLQPTFRSSVTTRRLARVEFLEPQQVVESFGPSPAFQVGLGGEPGNGGWLGFSRTKLDPSLPPRPLGDGRGSETIATLGGRAVSDPMGLRSPRSAIIRCWSRVGSCPFDLLG